MRQDGLSIPRTAFRTSFTGLQNQNLQPVGVVGRTPASGRGRRSTGWTGRWQGKLCHGPSHIFICRKDFLQGETSASATSGEKLTAVAGRGHWLQPAAGRSPWDSDQVSSVSSAQDTVPPIASVPDGGLRLSTIVTNMMRRMPSGPGRSAPQRGRAAGSALEDAPPSISSRPTPTS